MWELWRSKLGKESPRADSPRVASKIRAPVNFKDLNLAPEDDASFSDEEPSSPQNATRSAASMSLGKKGCEKTKLVIVMVGLPGRGKTFLCNKLKCYLTWLGHKTVHINVGYYRRQQKDPHEVQDAAFFDNNNKAGLEARERALQAALQATLDYLATDDAQIAIFDATNTTEERRRLLIKKFTSVGVSYMFIESVCTDPKVLEQNYMFKMRYSPDYQHVDLQQAVADFKERIKKYEEIYEPMDDRNLPYIKLIDMVTGRGYMDVNRISGYIPGKIVFFLMQVCKAGLAQARKIWLTRHGESIFNVLGKIGGDSSLSPRGEEYARVVPDMLIDRLPMTFNDEPIPVSVWTSTLRRTIETAQYLPFPKLRWKALDEIHAGICDGMTYQEIKARYPDEYYARKDNKLCYRYPSGESYQDVIQRLEPVITEIERERECVVIVAHQAILRAIYGYFMNVPLEEIPNIAIPLHTLIELRPKPDGTMETDRFPIRLPGAGGSAPKTADFGDAEEATTPTSPDNYHIPAVGLTIDELLSKASQKRRITVQ